MKKYDYLSLKAAQVTLRNAAERKGSWWKMFARYAEIAKRKIWWIEIGLLVCLILTIGGCISNTLDGMRQNIHNTSRPADQAKWTK